LRAADPAQASDPRFLSRAFLVDPGKVHGPGGIGYADRADFRPARTAVRLLVEADWGAVETLAYNCGEAAWTRSRLLYFSGPLFGLFVGDDLLAVSAYVPLGNGVAFVGGLVHPERRGRGLGRKVVHAAMGHAFEAGLVPHLRMLPGDRRTVELGKSLGFRPYASTLDVQLQEEEF